ncbi:MAG TPA: hypothetical protein VFN67_33360 [Polyangiales bacterium]|nr:hypothetical protein [Polyangiales bacterium]
MLLPAADWVLRWSVALVLRWSVALALVLLLAADWVLRWSVALVLVLLLAPEPWVASAELQRWVAWARARMALARWVAPELVPLVLGAPRVAQAFGLVRARL